MFRLPKNGVIFVVFGVIIHMAILGLLMLVLLAGQKSRGREGRKSYLVLLDTSGVHSNPAKIDQKGLPDSHDFSHFKDFFAIYPSIYCSGRKVKSASFIADYCSKPIKQYFDQHRLWKVWGADIASKYAGITVIPRIIPILNLVALVTTGLCVFLGLLSYCWSWLSVLTALVSIIAMLSSMALAGLCEYLARTVASNLNDFKFSKNSVIRTKKGSRIFVFLWTAAAVSVIATFFSVMTALSRRADRRRKEIQEKAAWGAGSSRFTPRPLLLLARRTTGLFRGKESGKKYNKDLKSSHYTEIYDAKDYSSSAFAEETGFGGLKPSREPSRERCRDHSRGRGMDHGGDRSRGPSRDASRDPSRERSPFLGATHAGPGGARRVDSPGRRYEPMRSRDMPGT
ncbi:hypothetical protein O9K51_08108 [Purpureocillium lavendulum]|uniref:Integral membrane protein n=1 Tax=Purpureocillium lavendulum TaxID=1247861 RepID=A0AB34FM41_9HYPO|nr:hypothetical protein O9K51_08108 [Purpureocillium lavendulum]